MTCPDAGVPRARCALRPTLIRCATLFVLTAGAAQAQTQPATSVMEMAAPESAALDPGTLAALDAMGRALRALPAFRVDAVSSTDAVLDTGQNVAMLHQTQLDVRRPDRARARVRGNGPERGMVYDGSRFTLYTAGGNGAQGYYGTVAAPPDLNALVDTLATRYGIELPLADLFYWGRSPDDVRQLVSAERIGLDRIGPHWCHHYALRQPGVDWEVWLQAGARPLPCRLVLTDTSLVSRPRHQVDYTWTLSPTFSAEHFRFRPEAGARGVPIETPPAPPTQGATP